MMNFLKKDKFVLISILIFLFFSFFWLFLFFNNNSIDALTKEYFSASYGLMALFGGMYGLITSKKWGGLKSLLGKSVIFLSSGLVFQELGQIIYSFYTFYFNIEIPYPSYGDIGFFGSVLFYIIGVFFLSQVAGVNISLNLLKNKIQAIIIPLLLLIISYCIFLKGYEFDWSKPLNIFLDFGYPLGQVVYLSIALITYYLSGGLLGGIMKKRILFILIALAVQYFADFIFLYQNYNNTWVTAGPNEFLYLVSYFLMTISLIYLNSGLKELQVKKT